MSFNEHKEQYHNERNKRWSMANNKEEKAIEHIVNILKEQHCHTGKLTDVTFCRYDTTYFEKYPPEEHQWVKGCPDYAVKINPTNPKHKNNYLLFEIKLKAQKFRKTIDGGRTKQGSDIVKYGCASYYLDIVPVYNNMQAFCKKTKISSQAFIICFVSENLKEIKVISLAKIDALIKTGWNGVPICTYGEGYGQNTYLIPEDAALAIQNIPLNSLLKASISTDAI